MHSPHWVRHWLTHSGGRAQRTCQVPNTGPAWEPAVATQIPPSADHSFTFPSGLAPCTRVPRTLQGHALLTSGITLPTAYHPTMAGDRLPRKVMDAKKLASLLRGGPGGPLVIDSRSFVEYNSCHVLSSVNICCSKLVKRRLQQGKVTIAELIQPATRSQVPVSHPCVHL